MSRRPPAQGSDAVLAYEFGFRRYVQEPSEQGLQIAYELGRAAVVQQCSMLDLAIAHHAALLGELRRSPGVDPQAIIDAAADFLLETLSAYEMQSRGFRPMARDQDESSLRRSAHPILTSKTRSESGQAGGGHPRT